MAANLDSQVVAVLPDHVRRLIAVVYADMVGYSRLIGIDDTGTYERMRELHRDLIDPALARHGGTLVSTGGDSLLTTFDSIIPAMRFAVDVQRGVPDFDGDYAPDRRIRFRMGINVGDVIPDGANLHGDGVNIAARLQSICPPGAICVTRVVRDHIGNRLGLDFKELGAIRLKNIARPIEAFVLEPTPPGAKPLFTRHLKRWPRIVAWGATALVGAGAVAGAIGIFERSVRSNVTPPQPVAASAAAGDLPALSIAVLPFVNLSGDPEQAYLADGISEDLTTDLSHLDNAFVIARESAFTYRGKSVDVRDVGRQLGVRYVLEGSVRKTNASVRITAQLVAADTGGQLWAEHFDKPIAELGEGQDDIVARIASALDVRMVNVESARRARAESGTPAAFDLILRARSILLEPVSEDRDYIALGLLLQALRVDPNSVPAMTGVAALLAGRFNSANNFLRVRMMKHVTELVAAAERRSPGSPDVLVAKFVLLQRDRRDTEALEIYRRLLGVDSSATGMILQIGLRCCWIYNPAAIPLLQKTIQLNPRSSGLPTLRAIYARALLLADRAEDARDVLLQTLALPPLPSPPTLSLDGDELGEQWRDGARMFLAIADVRTGRIDEAQRVVRQAMEAPSMRDFSVRSFIRRLRRYDDTETVMQEQRFAEDLRRAGFRDHLDEDADSGIPSTGELQGFDKLWSPTPIAIPGGRMVRTPEVLDILATLKPLVLTTTSDTPTIPGAIYISGPETGNLRDTLQENLKRMMQELSQGDLHRPIIVFASNINRWSSRNLALRLIALGYTDVLWYRGGWEAWEASGEPRAPLAGRQNL
jgi:adenylate cyclase